VQPHSEWLCQGDIFAQVPIVRTFIESGTEGGDGGSTLAVDGPVLVPAILITHGCELDKRTRGGMSKVRYLHFLPLRAMGIQDPNLQRALRAERVAPAAVLFVGDVPGIGETIAHLAEVTTVPAAYFTPQLRIPGDPVAQPDDMYLYPRSHDSRVGTLAKDRQALLRNKLAAYWSRITDAAVP
jgi:hypothetical protein